MSFTELLPLNQQIQEMVQTLGCEVLNDGLHNRNGVRNIFHLKIGMPSNISLDIARAKKTVILSKLQEIGITSEMFLTVPVPELDRTRNRPVLHCQLKSGRLAETTHQPA